jgi:hypothetical protein
MHAPSTAVCQGCKCPIGPHELAHVYPAPDGSAWYLHHTIAQCVAALYRAALARRQAAISGGAR